MVNALHLPPLPGRYMTPLPLSASRVKIASEMNSEDLLECGAGASEPGNGLFGGRHIIFS